MKNPMMPALSNGILDIVGLIAGKQMARIDAIRIVAAMQSPLTTVQRTIR